MKPVAHFSDSPASRKASPPQSLELRQSLIDQVESDMCHSIVVPLPGRTFVRQVDCSMRHFDLGQTAALSNFFYYMSIAITGSKIHSAVSSVRIITQGLFNNAHRFDKLLPVHRAQEAEAVDAIANGELVGGQLLGFQLYQQFDCKARFRELLLNPRQRQCQTVTLSLPKARKF